MGASLLVFANKTDVDGCMNDEDIRKVKLRGLSRVNLTVVLLIAGLTGTPSGCHPYAQMDYKTVQCNDWKEFDRRSGVGSSRCQRQAVFVLTWWKRNRGPGGGVN